MSEETIDLEKALKNCPIDYQTLRELSKVAILHDALEVRETAIEALTKHYQGLVRKAYVDPASGEIRVVMRAPQGEPKTFYVYKAPEKYLGKPINPVPFDLDEVHS
jgi:hypothetical protein